jgi:hypothetical protein
MPVIAPNLHLKKRHFSQKPANASISMGEMDFKMD